MSDALELHVTAARDAAAAGKTVADVPQVGSAGEMKTRLQEARATVSTAYERALEQQQKQTGSLVEAKAGEYGSDDPRPQLRACPAQGEDGEV